MGRLTCHSRKLREDPFRLGSLLSLLQSEKNIDLVSQAVLVLRAMARKIFMWREVYLRGAAAQDVDQKEMR